MISTIIFDIDLTLVDSLQACVEGTNLIARRFGLPEKSDREVLEAISLPLEPFWRKMWGGYDPAWRDYYESSVSATVDINRPLYPGAVELLKKARERGIALGVATNRMNPWLDLADMGIAEFFDTAVGPDATVKPKPHPDIPQLAVKQLHADASAVILVGDSPLDMKSALSAGIRGLGLTQGGYTERELLDAGAWKVRPDLAALDEFLDKPSGYSLG
ncbi:MAG: HAD family hydrolase [Deltaproteobacteria bacterium]|jgi:HAD superfamily hydrolase (TIGR01509 family)|nr:HAD family hydrolase [Deltaproteobacteria bacterium]